MKRTDYAEPRLEEYLLVVETGFVGSYQIPEQGEDGGFEDTY